MNRPHPNPPPHAGEGEGGGVPTIPVAAGCLVNEKGEVLIAQRPVGRIAAGKWEFPGGKIEAGETARQALERELREELGVTIGQARPLIRVRHAYSDRIVILDTWLVTAYSGDLHPHDGQALAWARPDNLPRWDLLAADRPIVTSLRLPADYVFTPPDADESRVLNQLSRLPAAALLRLRLPGLDDAQYASLARQVIAKARQQGLRVVLDRALSMAMDCGADGWHATASVVRNLAAPPGRALWTFASGHSQGELQRAKELGFDAVVLGPVATTGTHPDRAPLGWQGFESIAASSGLPVYAIGGLGTQHCAVAFSHYAQGVAGISAYWRSSSQL